MFSHPPLFAYSLYKIPYYLVKINSGSGAKLHSWRRVGNCSLGIVVEQAYNAWHGDEGTGREVAPGGEERMKISAIVGSAKTLAEVQNCFTRMLQL